MGVSVACSLYQRQKLVHFSRCPSRSSVTFPGRGFSPLCVTYKTSFLCLLAQELFCTPFSFEAAVVSSLLDFCWSSRRNVFLFDARTTRPCCFHAGFSELRQPFLYIKFEPLDLDLPSFQCHFPSSSFLPSSPRVPFKRFVFRR